MNVTRLYNKFARRPLQVQSTTDLKYNQEEGEEEEEKEETLFL